MNNDERDHLLEQSVETDVAFEKLIAPLRKADIAHGRIIKVLIIVITALLLMMLTISYALVRIYQNAHSLAKVTALCEKTNEANQTQRDLWDFILSIPPSSPQTDEQKQNRAEFVVRLDKAFAQKDCSL